MHYHCENCEQTFEDKESYIEHCYISYEDDESRVIVHDTPAENPRLKVIHGVREDQSDTLRYGHIKLVGQPFEEPSIWPLLVTLFVLAWAFGVLCVWLVVRYWR